ncbi:type II toxin-antitoxin system RelE/ParE family toxin [Chloroflexi bacterium TSY]|nr:type II toxin-antitoxin system RelE/ParE family toxin [Chloroflexi bacterium TSY]
MIQSFRNPGTEDVFNRVQSRSARRVCPESLWRVAQRKLDQLNTVVSLNSLRIPPGNRLETLRRDREGQYSIRINNQYRICFIWTNEGAAEVEIVDYH